MNGLIIKSPYIDLILEGKKTWEIRGHNTNIRGKIALIKKGSSCIVGTCEITDVIGPLSIEDMLSTHQHCINHERLRVNGLTYKNTYAWVLSNSKVLEDPIPYKHPRGAIIWVKLDEYMT